jgi:hypothetical protein
VKRHLRILLSLSLLALATACTTSTLPQKEAPIESETNLSKKTGTHHAGTQNAPEITKSGGAEGGVVVLWPRIAPKSDDPEVKEIATLAQSRLASLAEGLGVEVDKRPEPERVCPRPQGCKAVSLGFVLSKHQGGCALVATVSKPGESPASLVPWVGTVELRNSTVPFREPPESEVSVTEMASCTKLKKDLSANAAPADEAKLLAALKGALGK